MVFLLCMKVSSKRIDQRLISSFTKIAQFGILLSATWHLELRGLNEVRGRRPNDPNAPQVERIDATDPVITVHGDFAIARHYLKVVYKNGA